jgi:hypothetical protein
MTAIEAIKFARKRQGKKDGRVHIMLGNFCFLSDGAYTHVTTTVCGPIDVFPMDSIEAAEAFGEEALSKGFDSWMIPEQNTSNIILA